MDYFPGFGIEFSDRAFIDFGRVDMPVLGLGDSVRAEHAMALIRIRKNEGLEAPGIIDPVLVHGLDRVHAHFRHID